MSQNGSNREDILRGIGISGIVSSSSFDEDRIDTEENNPIPFDLFDQIYQIPTAPQCRVKGLVKDCHKTCEPGEDNRHGENLFLLPGENDYLRERLSAEGIEYQWTNTPVAVTLNSSCPYHQNGVCTIHDLRPFTCRSYPLRCHRIGEHSISVWSAMGCPYNCPTPESLREDEHHKRWIGAWKAVMPYLSDRWWTSFIRACPAGFRHVGDILDPREKGVPVQMIQRHADPHCDKCSGSGMREKDICPCIDRKSLRKIERDINQHRKRFHA